MVAAFGGHLLLSRWEWPYAVGMAAVVAFMMVVGWATERVAVRPLVERGAPILAPILALLGVLVVTRPGAGSFHPAALLSLSAAVFYALYSIITRILARTDSNGTTLFYSNIVGALVLLPVIPFVWTTPTEPIVIALMVASGAMGSAGHYFLIAAHRLAPAAVLSPFIYTEIVLVIVLGYLVFGDLPNRWTITGAAIVVASGLYILNRERQVRRNSGISPK